MSVLSDRSILDALTRGDIRIDPFDRSFLQSASYDLHLGSTFQVLSNSHLEAVVDPEVDQSHLYQEVVVPEGEAFVLHPGDFVLGASVEWFEFNHCHLGNLDGKSTLGRLGLVIHATAGYVDPGFKGTVTLELSSVRGMAIKLRPGIKIGQMRFAYTTTPVINAYGEEKLGSHYQGQMKPEPSKPL